MGSKEKLVFEFIQGFPTITQHLHCFVGEGGLGGTNVPVNEDERVLAPEDGLNVKGVEATLSKTINTNSRS